MKNSVVSLVLVFVYLLSFAQEEVVMPLQSNAKLYLETLPFQNKSTYIDQNVIITTDTLSIPFVDDFSTNTLKPLDFNTVNVSDTVMYANGSCVINADFDGFVQALHLTPSFSYSFNTGTNQVDSVPLSPIDVVNYSNTNCFGVPTSTTNYWLPYYQFSFDSITGDKIDSVLVAADTLMEVATIYFANLFDGANWVDNYAYWNTTFPVLPITIGVATMDGLNEFGLPYNNSVVNAYGDADLLTSKPINLGGLANDSAVYLSFFYQMQGFGDIPDAEDSLVVEFRNEFDGAWKAVWSISPDQVSSADFKQAYVEVRDTNLIAGPKYFYDEFQFRFRNKASISGNNDHWHIDYVRLDKNRALVESDTVIRDVALLYDFPSYLKNYTLLPWSQLQAGADELIDSIAIPIRDNGQVGSGISAGAFPINVDVTNSVTPDITFQLGGQNFNPTQEVKYQNFLPATDFTLPIVNSDSICSNALMYIAPTDRNVLKVNDTIQHQICYTNVMAYDDGSAERAYGLEGGTPNDVKKFAYKFQVAHTDTLAAIQIHFTNIDEDVSNLVFSLQVWDSLQLNTLLPYENLVGSIENVKPTYTDQRNGFVTFVFDTAITVTDSFYVGWAQIDNRNLQIGYDVNSTRGKEHMYVNTNNQWLSSSVGIEGSPMIRIILDGDYPLASPISFVNDKRREVAVYPNPVNDMLHVQVPEDVNSYKLLVIDNLGRISKTLINQQAFSVVDLPNGLYMLQLIDNKNGTSFYSKFVKTN